MGTIGLAVRAMATGLCERTAAPLPSAIPLQLDCNRASVGELATLPGVGPGRAQAIVLHRVRHGPFREPADLGAVDGIGPATLSGLLPFVSCGDALADRAR